MNWQDPTAIAAYIGLGGSGILALILKARKIWVRDNRDVTYDTEQTEWVKGLQGEIKQLRTEKDDLFARRLEDVTKLAQCNSANEHLTKELERTRNIITKMEDRMHSLRARLYAIEKNPLDSLPPGELND